MIRMRENKNSEEFCSLCNTSWKNTRVMHDIKMNDEIFHLCHKCSNELFQKLLKASSMYDGRLKTKEDMARINRENRTENKDFGSMKVSEALKGIKDEKE